MNSQEEKEANGRRADEVEGLAAPILGQKYIVPTKAKNTSTTKEKK